MGPMGPMPEARVGAGAGPIPPLVGAGPIPPPMPVPSVGAGVAAAVGLAVGVPVGLVVNAVVVGLGKLAGGGLLDDDDLESMEVIDLVDLLEVDFDLAVFEFIVLEADLVTIDMEVFFSDFDLADMVDLFELAVMDISLLRMR